MLRLSDAKQHTVLLSTKESMSGFVPLLFQCSYVFCLIDWRWLSITALTCVRVRAIGLWVPTFLCVCVFVHPHTKPPFKLSQFTFWSTDVRRIGNTHDKRAETSSATRGPRRFGAVRVCVCVLMGCANKLSVVTVAISTSHCQKVAEQLSDFSGLSIHCSRQILPSFFILVDVVVIVPSLITSKQHYATYSSCIILNSLFACLMGCVVWFMRQSCLQRVKEPQPSGVHRHVYQTIHDGSKAKAAIRWCFPSCDCCSTLSNFKN